jgi:hypothetical protein
MLVFDRAVMRLRAVTHRAPASASTTHGSAERRGGARSRLVQPLAARLEACSFRKGYFNTARQSGDG